jgi:pyruvate dehydrogenase E1 component beta subunit
MLAPALADPDPVVMFEHSSLYNSSGALGAGGAADIDRAVVRRPGTDVTLVTYGGCLPKALDAADVLSADGVSAEVVDLRVLRPIDWDTVLGSVRTTRRAVVVDEGWHTLSIAGEVSARIAEEAFYDLDAPVRRVCTAEVPIPYARHLERAALPSVERVVEAAEDVVGSG